MEQWCPFGCCSRASGWQLLLCFIAALLLQHTQPITAQGQTQTPADILPVGWRACNSIEQLINCDQIPLTKEFRPQRRACCRQYRPERLPPEAQTLVTAASVQQAAVATQVTRTDLTADYLSAPNYFIGQTNCPRALTANVPTFSTAATSTNVAIVSTTRPWLTKAQIQRVKSSIISGTSLPADVKNYYNSIRKVNTVNGVSFNHPGSGAGAAELALMRNRLNSGNPVQIAALDTLVNGTGVKPKTRVSAEGTWAPPTDCKPTGYYGPLPMPSVQTRYSGFNAPGMTCPTNYPSTAPQNICGHVVVVELDGQMAYKMAMAFHATGDTRYSDKVIEIADKWCSTNTKWGWWWENGPLEAGWGIAAMARALELVRHRIPSGNNLISRFGTWVMGPPYRDNIIYNIEYYLNLTKVQNRPNTYGNWHTTLAETYMAVGVLADNITTYNKGVALFNTTLSDYLKWGKGAYATARVLGECSETLRDMYHSQFGLGGLLQAAEIAWQQDDASLYARDNFALVSMMETLARLTNAWLANSTSMLPAQFVYYNSRTFPAPPANCSWRFNMETQLWTAYWTINGSYAGVELRDGNKYLLGFGFLPTGWEMGYNHYAGRLGIPMPETAALISKSWPEWQEFHWGLGTLSHAQTAIPLWRNGLTSTNLCPSSTRTALITRNAVASTITAAAAGSSDVVTESAGSSTTSDSGGSSTSDVVQPMAVSAAGVADAVTPSDSSSNTEGVNSSSVIGTDGGNVTSSDAATVP